MNTHHLGSIGESAVELDLLKRGFNVLRPLVPSRYDLIVDLGNKRSKSIQVKVATPSPRKGEDALQVKCSYGKGKRKTYTSDEIDIIAAYDPRSHKIYYVPMEAIEQRDKCNSNFTLRLSEDVRPNVIKPALLAEDFSNFPF